jgi:hypothetical protein
LVDRESSRVICPDLRAPIGEIRYSKQDTRLVVSMYSALSIEKGGAVPYRDLFTILRLALMQYITKLAMLQIRSPGPPSHKLYVK